MEFINQNILLISIVVVSALGILWQTFGRAAGAGVSPAEATLLINREDALIVDVRDASEFAAGHLPEARNIPLGTLEERLGELEKFKDKPLIVVCTTGIRAGKGCGMLKKAGFTRINNLAGGVDAWVGAGYPIKKGASKK